MIENPSRSKEMILDDLKTAINRSCELSSIRRTLKCLVNELAARLVESGECDKNQVSKTVKQLLHREIEEKKITRQWIEKSLTKEYKRSYQFESKQSLLSKSTEEVFAECQTNGNCVAQSCRKEKNDVILGYDVAADFNEADTASNNVRIPFSMPMRVLRNYVKSHSQMDDEQPVLMIVKINKSTESATEVQFKDWDTKRGESLA